MCWTLSQSLPSSCLASHGASKVSVVPILFLSLEAPSHSYGTLGRSGKQIDGVILRWFVTQQKLTHTDLEDELTNAPEMLKVH